jgi:hypothetical protein
MLHFPSEMFVFLFLFCTTPHDKNMITSYTIGSIPVWKIEINGRRDPLRWLRNTIYP